MMFKKCEQCKQDALFVKETVYDGFKKIGETQRCSLCGNLSTSSAASGSKVDPLAALFGEDARPETLSLFDVEEETARLCRKCNHYVIHPFTQRCGLHDKEVSATDSCADFEKKVD